MSSVPVIKGDNILVKAEFIVPKKEVVLETNAVEEGDESQAANTDEGVGTKRRLDSRERNRNKQQEDGKKISLKNRHQSSHPNKEDRLCSHAAKGNPCPFKESCSYSHDIKDYLSKKEPDLGPICYQFETFGFCPNGVMCRFGSSHIDSVNSVCLTRSEDKGGVIERTHINVLSKDAQFLLRKKKYDRGVDYYKAFNKNNKRNNNNNNNNNNAQQKKPDQQIHTSTEASAEQKDEPAAEVVSAVTVSGDVSAGQEVSAVVADATTTVEVVDTTTPTTATAVPTATPSVTASVSAASDAYNLSAYPSKTVKLVDFSNKVYVAPLTTVGNLPFRRILKEYGADITCGEMAMANNIVAGQASEWALLRRHASEDCFGVQVAGGYADTMSLTSRVLENEVQSDFVDLNSACPIDLVCNRGCGSALMNKSNRLFDILGAMTMQLPSRSVTIKIRTGWNEKAPIAHDLIPQIQSRFNSRMAAIMLHGRSRLQRYHKLANWEYILQAAQSQNPSLRRIPVVGNGDILSWEDWQGHQHMIENNMHRVAENSMKIAPNNIGADVAEIEGNPSEIMGLCNTAMLARGALIKPWLPQEIKEQRVIDIPATERLDILRKFCNYGLEHWGSDQQGVNNTRRFLLEWMSFLHRYVPAGILEQPYAQGMNQRPPQYMGRGDLETLLSSPSCDDWIKVSEMFLGPVAKDYVFTPKHKSNSYRPETDIDATAAAAEQLPEG